MTMIEAQGIREATEMVDVELVERRCPECGHPIGAQRWSPRGIEWDCMHCDYGVSWRDRVRGRRALPLQEAAAMTERQVLELIHGIATDALERSKQPGEFAHAVLRAVLIAVQTHAAKALGKEDA